MSKVRVATVMLHISVALYVLIGLISAILTVAKLGTTILNSGTYSGQDIVWLVTGFLVSLLCVGLAVGIEIIAYGIRRRKKWGWIAGVILFGLYTPSLFLPLGVLGLYGLLAEESQKEFCTR